MATHNLFQGGLPDYAKSAWHARHFPSKRLSAYDDWAVDERKSGVYFANSRHLDLSCDAGCADCGERQGSLALRDYVDEHEIVVADVLSVIGIPKFTLVDGVWINIETARAGFTFNVVIEGLAASSVPAPVAVGAVDAGVAGSQYFHFATPLYFNHNDYLNFTITAMPGAPAVNCSGCSSSLLGGLKMQVAVMGREIIRGDVVS